MHTLRLRYAFRVWWVSLALSVLAGCATPPPPGDLAPVDRLLTLMNERLSYMDDVARNKWNSGAAIEDLPREAQIIADIGVQAASYGLSADIAQDFLRAQIEASKIIQHKRFAQWKQANQPPFTNAPDLRNSIRPALDRLTPLMMRALAQALPTLRKMEGPQSVRSHAMTFMMHVDGMARDEAIGPLKRLTKR